MLESYLSYQGMARTEILRFLRHLCLGAKEELLELLCADDTCADTAVHRWATSVCVRLERAIQATASREGREAQAMSLFHDPNGAAQALRRSCAAICSAYRLNQESVVDSVLWNTLKQYFQRKMDELDGHGADHGTHVLQVRRRLAQLAKNCRSARAELDGPRTNSPDLAELAADMALEIRSSGLKNLPTTPDKILEYLYQLEEPLPLPEDPWDDKLLFTGATSPSVLLQFEQCFHKLPEELREALAIKFGLTDQLTFLSQEGYQEHYRIGPEAWKKRTSKARQLLLDCLLGEF